MKGKWCLEEEELYVIRWRLLLFFVDGSSMTSPNACIHVDMYDLLSDVVSQDVDQVASDLRYFV